MKDRTVRVLVVEDEESMAASLQRGLEAEGYVVDVAADGEDGLWLASEFGYDAVVLDVMLPKLNGLAVAQRLRAAGRDVPVLVLTAKTGDDDQTEALDSGADDFLSKPFSYDVLLARLRALIRRGSASRTAVLRVGDLTIDQAARTCARSGVAVALTAREFALLEYLALHAGRVVSKQTLLRHVWSEHDDYDTNVVEVYVGYLRRKLDLPGRSPLLHTVRGQGYLLSDRAPDG
jgi:two-component system, OmpR family, response regulator